jgi:hypothetical protein
MDLPTVLEACVKNFLACGRCTCIEVIIIGPMVILGPDVLCSGHVALPEGERPHL